MNFLRSILRLLANPTSLLHQCKQCWSWLVFRMRYGFLHMTMPENGPVMLIVNFHETPYRAITEGCMAQACVRLQGVTPVVLSDENCGWSRRYYETLGITRFIQYSAIADSARNTDDEKLITEFLEKRPSLDEQLAFQFMGINVGVHVLSTVLRRLHAGHVDLADPKIRSMVTQTFLQSLTTIRAAKTLLAELKPALIIFNEAGYTPYGEVYEVALQMGCNVVQYLHSQRMDALILKRGVASDNMVDAISLSRDAWEDVKNRPWSNDEENAFMREYIGHYEDASWFNFTLSKKKKYKTPEEVRTQLGLDPQKKTAVIFTHVTWDASFFFGKNLFADYDKWLVETVRVACDNPHLNWIIKLHPDYIWHTQGFAGDSEMRDMIAIKSDIGTLPDHIKIVPPDTDINTYSFFGFTDYCITVRGTIGYECPCFGITTLTAGTGRYSGMGFTEDSQSIAEYLEKIRMLHTIPALSPERTTLARRHAWGLLALRPLRFHSFELVPTYKNGDVSNHKIIMHAKSRQDAENDPGLTKWAQWALTSTQADYLA